MSKQWHRLTFKSLQPLHIGSGGYGVLSPTRLFIPGYTMWGALTAGLGRFLGKSESELNLDPFVEISNFYPVIKEEICFPVYKNGALFLGNISEKEFRRNFTDTVLLTSIDPANQAARETSLHEIETLLPARKGKGTDVLKWSGIVFIDLEDIISASNLRLANYLKEDLKLQVGGEKNYGFGLICLEKIKALELGKMADWNVTDHLKNEISINGKSAHHVDTRHVSHIIKGEPEIDYKIAEKDIRQVQIFFSQVYPPGCEGEKIVGELYRGLIR